MAQFIHWNYTITNAMESRVWGHKEI
jgi:hypothetical protein